MLKLVDGVKIKNDAPKIHFIQKIIKGETWMVMAQSAVEIEDEFSSLYFTQSHVNNLFLSPPFDPNTLLNLVQTNNILNQCIEAMEVNIDGTGHEFEPVEDGETVDKAEEKTATSFFTEPYPNLSFVSLRRKLRRQMESVGYGYIEVIRSIGEDLVGLRNLETPHVRMVKLDEPIQVTKTISRDGKDVKMTLWERERRFAQRVSLATMIYYREYGTTRHVHRETGHWETPEKPIPVEKRAAELIMFGINPDTMSPYFLPRWINNLPSVIGSRNAEEQNLQFLDAGGMPPAIVFLQGGTIVKDASDQLKAYLSGQNKNKNRAVVVEVQSSSGSLDAASKVDVKVERFGAEKAQDAMFMGYDERNEEHVRKSFRLPPLFIGDAVDYSFATAQVSYMVAEAQVFGPERGEFDEIMNKTVIKELKLKSLKFHSKPITLKDVASQIEALKEAKDVATRESFIKETNMAVGMNLELAPMPHPNVTGDQEHPGQPTIAELDHGKLPASTKPPVPTSPQPEPEPPPQEQVPIKVKPGEKIIPFPSDKKMKKTAIEIIDLAYDYATLRGLVRKREISPEKELMVREAVNQLDVPDKLAFGRLLATYAFGSDSDDLVDIVNSTL